jgi:hypothetical protein
MKTLEFIYQETQIHFLVNPTDANVMVNATEMAKLFGKETKDFLRLKSTKKYLNRLLEKLNIVADVPRYNEIDLVYSNNKAGTFMDEMVALKFAAWLDVDFEIWVYSCIQDILFGNYKKHWEAHARQEEAKQKMEIIKVQIIENPTSEMVIEYFERESQFKQAKNAKTKAIQNQLKLFGSSKTST